ncbi:MAG: CesT family type III secretion system chaperone [Endozoicomonadaceae bacterium]|nr:CesT family type III secretion system chaperone [Endozoicomonadaceae bacterium]
MDFKALMTQFAKNNHLDSLTEEKGRYTLIFGDHDVFCYSRNKCIWLEADLGKIAENTRDQAVANNLLLTRSTGFIRDERACLSIDEETQHYYLHQRILLANITPQNFQQSAEQFGGCLCYVADLIKQGMSGISSAAGGIQA